MLGFAPVPFALPAFADKATLIPSGVQIGANDPQKSSHFKQLLVALPDTGTRT